MNSEQKISIGLLLFSAAYLVYAYQIPAFPFPVPVDADAFPKILGYLLLGLSFLLFREGSKKRRLHEQEAPDDSDNTAESTETAEVRVQPKGFWSSPAAKFIVVVFAMVLYAAFIESLGFVVVTMLFLFGITRFLGYRRHWVNGIVAAAFSFGMFYIFTKVLGMNLPKGVLSWIL